MLDLLPRLHQPSSVIPRRSNVSVSLRPSIRSSLFPPSPFTPSPFTAALHSAARHPSIRCSSPFTSPAFALALYSPTPHSLPSPPFTLKFRRPSPFTPTLHSRTLHARPSLHGPLLSRPSLYCFRPFIRPAFTLHSHLPFASPPVPLP
jgi:hypothetical protein